MVLAHPKFLWHFGGGATATVLGVILKWEG